MLKWIVLLSLCVLVISHSHSGKMLSVNIELDEAQHVPLGGTLTLPCLFTDGTALDPAHPLPHRIKWSHITREKSSTVLVAVDGQMRISQSFVERVHLLNYPRSPNDATITISGLRSSDSGFFRCEVQRDIEDSYDFVYVKVEGIVFHYRAILGRYSLTYEKAEIACEHSSAVVASPEQLQAAFDDGLHQCNAGWLSDHTVRYPIQEAHENCGGSETSGIRSYGVRDLKETYDVYCFTETMKGRVFYTSTDGKYKYAEAIVACYDQEAVLATTGQLYMAWQDGLDVCNAGWLMDRSVRYPINTPRQQCGGGQVGVQSVYTNADQTGYPPPDSQYDAFCYKEFPVEDEEDYDELRISSDDGASGDEDYFTIVDLNYDESPGVVFHYRRPSSRYDYNFVEAQLACIYMGAAVANLGQLEAAYEAGYHHCDSGWILDQTSRYPIVYPRTGCTGNLGNKPGIRTYGLRPASEKYDVYCYMDGIDGEVFHVGSPEGLTFAEAATGCQNQNGRLATTAELYAAWKSGFNKCRPGWLSDGSVRYPITQPTSVCGAGKKGVHAIYTDNRQTNFPDASTKYDAYCYRDGTSGSSSGSGSGGISVGSFPSEEDSSTDNSGSSTSGDESGSSQSGDDSSCDPCEPNPCGDAPCTVVDGVAVCQSLDACRNNPCVNGATCMGTPDSSYVCLCLPGYGGKQCQLEEHQCKYGWTNFQGNCYLFVSDKKSWTEAELHCQGFYSHLVSIVTPEEQRFIYENVNTNQWIGLNDKTVENDFRWVDGTPLQYINWVPGYPKVDRSTKEDCVGTLTLRNDQWVDIPCCTALPFTCKKCSVSCGPPPTVENAFMYGSVKNYYPINAIVRYQCNPGFKQYYLPVIHCQPDGQWEEPQVRCVKVTSRRKRAASTNSIH